MTTHNYLVLTSIGTYNSVTNEFEYETEYQTLNVIVPSDVTNFSFTSIPDDLPEPGELPDVGSISVNVSGYAATLDEHYIDLADSEASAIRVTWNNNGTTVTTDVLAIDFYNFEDNLDFFILAPLAGTPFPVVNSIDELEAFLAVNLISMDAISDGPFASDQDIAFTAPASFAGSSEDDEFSNLSGAEEVFGGAGEDEIQIFSDQTVYGGQGDDQLYSNARETEMEFYGGDGEDRLIAFENNYSLFDGGAEDDTLQVTDSDSDFVEITLNHDDAGTGAVDGYQYDDVTNSSYRTYTTHFTSIEEIDFDTRNDRNLYFFGDDEDNTIRIRGTGPEYLALVGGEGVDTIDLTRVDNDNGGSGLTISELLTFATIYFQADDSYIMTANSGGYVVGEFLGFEQLIFVNEDGGSDVVVNLSDIAEDLPVVIGDTFFGSGLADELDGTDGDDKINGGGGNDDLEGGLGNDDVNGGIGFDNILGGAGSDSLTGLQGYDTIYGGTGDDTINGNSGNDELYGGIGNDVLTGGQGADQVYGAAGNDVLTGQGGADELFGSLGNDTLNGNASADLLFGESGADQLNGGSGFDSIYGGTGDDVLNGGSGFDNLFGNDGNDILNGNSGSDTLDGGNGDDIVRGGIGADQFEFDDEYGHDIFIDFSNNIDELYFSTHIVANFTDLVGASEVVDGNLVFTFAADHTLTLNNITNVNALEDDVTFL